MANACKAQELLRQTDAENTKFSKEAKRLDQRVSSLAVFERAVLSRLPTTKAAPEGPPDDSDLHKEVDLFTHYKFRCPSRKHISKFDRSVHGAQACRACYDSSSTMDSETWQPVNHGTTLQKFPSLVKKETKDRRTIEMGPAGSNGILDKPLKVSQTPDRSCKSEGHNMENENFSSPVRRPRPVRGRSLRGKGVRRKNLVPESPSSDNMSTRNQPYEEHVLPRHSRNEIGEDHDEKKNWNKNDGHAAEDSSGPACRSRSLEDNESYRESSSPVKAWYMRPERMGSTSE